MIHTWKTSNGLSWLISFGLSFGLLGCSLSSSPLVTSAEPPTNNSTSPTQEQPSMEIQQASSFAQQLPITAYVILNGTRIDLEVAMTRREQAIGLMYRPFVADNRGMLFPFSPPRPVSFWMRNVQINLDMVFIRDNSVVEVEAQVPPCHTDTCPTYGPRDEPVDAVLELRGGRAAELGIEKGDPIDIVFQESPLAPSSESHDVSY